MFFWGCDNSLPCFPHFVELILACDGLHGWSAVTWGGGEGVLVWQETCLLLPCQSVSNIAGCNPLELTWGGVGMYMPICGQTPSTRPGCGCKGKDYCYSSSPEGKEKQKILLRQGGEGSGGQALGLNEEGG